MRRTTSVRTVRETSSCCPCKCWTWSPHSFAASSAARAALFTALAFGFGSLQVSGPIAALHSVRAEVDLYSPRILEPPSLIMNSIQRWKALAMHLPSTSRTRCGNLPATGYCGAIRLLRIATFAQSHAETGITGSGLWSRALGRIRGCLTSQVYHGAPVFTAD